MEEKIQRISGKALQKKPEFQRLKGTPVFSSEKLELENLQRLNAQKALVLENKRKRPSFIRGKITDSKIESAEQAIKALNNIHHLMKFENAEQEFSADSEYEVGSTKFYRFQQYSQGIPVYGHQMVMSVSDEGVADTVSGYYVPIAANDAVTVSSEEAEQIVRKASGKPIADNAGLQYYVDDNEKATLCWVVSTEEKRYFVNANGGAIVDTISLICDYNQVVNIQSKNMLDRYISYPVCWNRPDDTFKLWDPKKNIRIYDAQLKTDTLGKEVGDKTLSNMGNNKEAITVYEHALKIYDYYKNILGWSGSDNQNKLTHITVNYWCPSSGSQGQQTPESNPYVNAFYSGGYKHTQICIGNGRHIANGLDVLAHEFTHAVSNDVWKGSSYYRGECGAVNEAYSDILGELIQDGIIDIMGETVDGYSKNGFRNLTTHITYDSIMDPNASYDNGYVHQNSKIISHAAYLMQKDWPSANSRHELATLFFRSMPYLFTKCNFVDCRVAVLQAAYCMKLSEDKIKVIKAAFDEVKISGASDAKAAYDPAKRVYSLSGIVTDAATQKPVNGALIRFAEGHTRFNTARADQSPIFLKTDVNGHYYTSALKPGNYSMLVTKSIGNGKHLESRVNVTIDGANVRDCSLSELETFYVTEIAICSDKNSTTAKSQCPNYQVLLDKDLNKGAGGLYMYVRYYLSCEGTPITNICLVKSSQKITWSEASFTLDGITAKYKRIDVDLNCRAGGKYVYLCYTTDKVYRPLTGINAMYDSDDLVDPWIMATWGGTYESANVNEGTKGIAVYLNRKVQEESNQVYL